MMATATKAKAKPSPKTAKSGKRKPPRRESEETRPPLFERLTKAFDDVRRHFQGEDVGVTTTVYVSPQYAATVVAEVKAAREAAGLTLAQVAARARLTVGTLAKLESGKTPNPTVDTLARYAAAAGRVLTLGTVPMKHPLV